MPSNRIVTRRLALAITAGLATLPVVARARSAPLGYVFSASAADRALGLAPPLACTRGTRTRPEGPYYTPLTPRRTVLREPDARGTPLVLQGLVLTPDCRPVADAAIDLWHSDENGHYDNAGFRYRGHQFTDAAGAFRFETIRPARYPARTSHIHVKVQGEATYLLTTQLFFPDLPDDNARDWIYRDDLLLRLTRTARGLLGRFDFVLAPLPA